MTVTSMLVGPAVALGLVLPVALKATEPPAPTAVEVLAAKQVADISTKLDRVEKTLNSRDCLDHPKGE
jgi:hypothetical protein